MSLVAIYSSQYFGSRLLLWQQVVLISQLEGDSLPGFLELVGDLLLFMTVW